MAEKSHQILITGTGRAVTSFLVKYLAELGLDTHLAHHDAPDGEAEAGLEDLPLLNGAHDLPYVVKSPWLAEYLEPRSLSGA